MSAPGKPMCILTIGFEKVLLPFETGTKVMNLLSAAESMEDQFHHAQPRFVRTGRELTLEMEKYSPPPAARPAPAKAKP